MKWRNIYIVASCLVLNACTNPFGYDWVWAPKNPDDFGLRSGFQYVDANRAIYENANKHFRESLRGCVAAYDPGHSDDLGDDGDYAVSGWFVDKERVRPVLVCMEGKGWRRDGRFNL